jgi:LAO/AO transport system kinase
MVVVLRVRGHRVGVLAVDPSSPFTGGAVLGDRIRMQRHALDEGVFVRSMATRGQLGGLARTTREAALVLDAMGFDVILIETVGVGQDEVDVAELAHTTVVASPPGMGDDIQAMKSGIFEIGDVFVVNKADHPGTDEAVAQLRGMLGMRGCAEGDWLPPVLRTIASAGEGIAELVDTCFAHRHHLSDSGLFAGHMFRWELHVFKELVKEMTFDKLFGTHNENSRELELLVQKLKARKIDPYSAAESLVQRV